MVFKYINFSFVNSSCKCNYFKCRTRFKISPYSKISIYYFSTIFFVIRDNELDSYFKNYFKAETIENIQKLSPDKIIDKLNKFDFLIYEDMITLLHKDNDFTENK